MVKWQSLSQPMFVPLLWLSAVSFLGYGLGCVFTGRMRAEFERFGLARHRVIVGVTQLAGSVGLVAGLHFPVVGLVASGGFALQMLMGVGVRIAIGDSLLQTLPATFYCVLNAYLFSGLLSQ